MDRSEAASCRRDSQMDSDLNDAASTPRHVHLLESAPMGHGPSWLELFIEAVSPCSPRLTLSYPRNARYESWLRSQECLPPDTVLRPMPVREGRLHKHTLAEAAEVNADVTLITYLDDIVHGRVGPIHTWNGGSVWGIWFNPVSPQTMSWMNPKLLISGRTRRRHQQQRALREPGEWLTGIFVLDNMLADRICQSESRSTVVLPDPWFSDPKGEKAAARRQLGLPEGGTLFLHAGVADPRKGIGDAVRAWQTLDQSTNACLLRVGDVPDADATQLQALADSGTAIFRPGWASASDLDKYLISSDWVLLPYRDHEGSSAFLAGAAQAGRPILAADYGVIGARVTQYVMGETFAHKSVEDLSGTIAAAVNKDTFRYQQGLAQYASEHSRSRFLSVVRRAWGLTTAYGPAGSDD